MNYDNYLNCFTKSPCKWYRFRDNWIHYTSCIKFAWQRAVRGFSDRDVWELACWHTDLMRAALTHFRNNLHGHPAHFHDEGDEDLGQKMWEDHLDKIIALLDKCDEEIYNDKEMAIFEKYDLTNPEMKELTKEERDQFHKELDALYKERCGNIKEALRLLGEEYWDLWD